MATCKFNVGDKVRRINSNNGRRETNFKVGQVGTVVNISNGSLVDVEVNGVVNKGNSIYNLELVEAAPKFKVGDRVIIEESNIEYLAHYAGRNVEGMITRTDGYYTHPYWVVTKEHPSGLYCKVKCLVEDHEKIVITHDGKTTTATMYRGDGSKVTATAKCAPEDDFNFQVGAEIAMGRLVDKLAFAKFNIIRVTFREGEQAYSYKTRMQTAKVGMKIVVPVGQRGKELEATVVEIIPGAEYNGEYAISAMKEIDIVDAPQYWTGRAVCIGGGDSYFTEGKIYKVDNGKFTDNCGHTRPITTDKVTNPNDLTAKTGYFSNWDYKFIPLVEDENKPLTTEEIKKMDGEKVYCVPLNSDTVEMPVGTYDCGGWHTVDVKKEKLLKDKSDEYYRFASNNTSFGFHAYRTKPTNPTK